MATSTLFMSWIASGIYNLDSQRFQKASLDTRTEGWTETWGEKQDGSGDDETRNLKSARKLHIDDESVSQLLSTPYPKVEIVLTQHRPAWFEQLLMRVAGIPHIVLNSNHISNEATGQLPYLRDCRPSKPPILVGRNHPSNLKKNDDIIGNSIFSYLQNERKLDLDEKAGVTTDEQRGLSKCFQYMINLELSKILLHLRFEDPDAWEQVYRKQYVGATNGKLQQNIERNLERNGSWFSEIRGRFQAAMERNVEKKRLLGYSPNGEKNGTTRLLERAKDAYFAIDRQLLSVNKAQDETNSRKYYLLGTERPALVDVLLWAHLAEALCDVHLVVVLASYPRILKYFQDMYDSYFPSGKESPGAGCTWMNWNDQQNLSNAFQKIPTLSKHDQSRFVTIKDAVDLMQKTSLQKEDFLEVMKTVKSIRAEERHPKQREPQSYLLYRWSMGESPDKQPETADKTQENPIRQKLLRDQARNDQMWISQILGISAVAVFLIRGGT